MGMEYSVRAASADEKDDRGRGQRSTMHFLARRFVQIVKCT